MCSFVCAVQYRVCWGESADAVTNRGSRFAVRAHPHVILVDRFRVSQPCTDLHLLSERIILWVLLSRYTVYYFIDRAHSQERYLDLFARSFFLKRFAGFAVVVSKLRCDIESYLENVFCCAAAQNLATMATRANIKAKQYSIYIRLSSPLYRNNNNHYQ